MKILKTFFEFYLRSSLHVSIAVWTLYKISCIYTKTDETPYLGGLVFTSTLVGYNIIKYGYVFINNRKLISKKNFSITFICLILGMWCFLNIDLFTQFIFIISLSLVILYLLPIVPFKTNLRNYSGLKIFLVAFTWTLVSYFSLISEIKNIEPFQIIIMGFQRFIFVLVATIPFEIRDIKFDQHLIGTLPQRFGVFKTKLLGLILLCLNTCLLYFFIEIDLIYKLVESFIYFILSYALIISSVNNGLNFARFWVEGIPIIWYFILLFLIQIF